MYFAILIFFLIIVYSKKIHELKIVISTSEGNYRETLNVVAEKSKENAYLKNELNQLKQSKEQYLDQVIFSVFLLIYFLSFYLK